MLPTTIAIIVFEVMHLALCKYHNIIDVDDILSADYMPGNLLMLENPEATAKNFSYEHNKHVHHFHNKSAFDGTINKALSTMLYHRNKMNEYFCRNYIAEQIVEGLSLTRLKRRSGNTNKKLGTNITTNHKDYSMLDNMIEDEGSSNYKSWLTKSTTLEDIYKHYQTIENRDSTEEDTDYDNKNDKHEEFYDENTAPVGPAKVGYGNGMSSGYGTSGHGAPHSGYSYSGHGMPPSSHGYVHSGPPLMQPSFDTSGHGHAPVHVIHETVTHHEHVSGGKDLSELFELALTALAFLAFKLFLLHVVMCIAHAKKKDHYMMTIIPITTPSTTTGTVGTAMSGGEGAMDVGGGDGGVNVGMTGPMGSTGAGGGMTGAGGMTGTGGMTGDAGGTTSNGDAGVGGEEGVGETGGGGEEEMIPEEVEPGETSPAEEGGDDGGDGGEEDVGMTAEEAPEEGDLGDGEEVANEGADEDVTGIGGGGDDTRIYYFASTKRPYFIRGRSSADTGEVGTMIPGRRRRRRKRKKRKTESKEIPASIANPDTEALNELARHILTSIEAALVAHQDKGSCLRKVLCQNNKYARTLENSNKIWIPVWNLGMSWLSGKLTKGVPTATSMLDSLKASILGLGKANCEVIYQECDLHRQRALRRRRRRRK